MAPPKEEATFPKAFAMLNVLNVPLALAYWPSLSVGVPLMAALTKLSTATAKGQEFDKKAEQASLNALTITSSNNRLVRACIGSLNLVVGVRCAAYFGKGSFLWSSVNFLQVLGVFVTGGMWLTTAAYGQ
eukprot:CAMPEP_0197682992 /NCGR_PEP_ID=MMETSP1338-20131121/97273_1 /TAXON_ID=43686 ORGANISM="Pelagodinium beii, Strain RCC1491" /NCGR_SAMPLE_ID=MMETSP1338 /ASSEMBLY_ACC=CAM_ASM_000754 /LENGTH=129 /DNA_ID=CAMNT_0043264517 /DNA_START=87 /DNA_END=476 /DNA_ORIENTATION=-